MVSRRSRRLSGPWAYSTQLAPRIRRNRRWLGCCILYLGATPACPNFEDLAHDRHRLAGSHLAECRQTARAAGWPIASAMRCRLWCFAEASIREYVIIQVIISHRFHIIIRLKVTLAT